MTTYSAKLQPWAVQYQEPGTNTWKEIATYRNRFEAENHRDYLRKTLDGTIQIIWRLEND